MLCFERKLIDQLAFGIKKKTLGRIPQDLVGAVRLRQLS